MNLLQIRNLSKIFNRGTVNESILFDNLSLTIYDGDFITIIGSNGAGKSTLLNIISGNTSFDDGEIILNKNNISRLPEHKRTKFIGRVFQDPSSGVAPSMTILENLSMAYNKGKKFGLSFGATKKERSLFKELLKEYSIGLEEKLDVKVGSLSGGQRQALSLVMASISKPSVMLLDEHTAALDPSMSSIVLDLTSRVVNENNMTTLMITHDMSDAIRLGNRLIMLHRGKIILDICGEAKKKLTTETLLEYFKSSAVNGVLSDRMLFA